MLNPKESVELAIKKALEFGADEADAVVVKSSDTSCRVRFGEIENIESSESCNIGVRVFVKGDKGYKTSIISSNNFLESNIIDIAKRAVDTAKLGVADEHIRIADESEWVKEIVDLEIYCDKGATPEELKDWAIRAEKAALAVKKVTNSEGADAGHSESETFLATSKGFYTMYKSSGYQISVSVIAEENGAMETEYEYSYAINKNDLEAPEKIGKKAGELAVSKLNPKRAKTCKVPIIFDKRVSKQILSSLTSAVNGASVAKKSSFLHDKMEQQIFPENISIYDDPLMKRAQGSQPCDAEGIFGEKIPLVEKGVLKNWLLDLRSASKLGLKSNGRSSRGIGSNSSPASTNVYMENGTRSAEEMIAKIKDGLYLMEAFGMGVNTITGDYSQGASGFWIKDGKITHPVSEITVAGNLKDMFMNLEAANDLEFRYSKNAPTLLIHGMTIAGTTEE